MIEWILVVWLVVAGANGPELAEPVTVGTYRQLSGEHGCEAALSKFSHPDPDVSFIALCIERDKQ